MNANRFITHSLRDPRIANILAAAIDAVEPGKLVLHYLQKANLPKHERVFLLGIGKASEAMTIAASEYFGDFVEGLVITKHALRLRSGRFNIMEGGHPIPDERSVIAGQAALDLYPTLTKTIC